MRRTPLITLTSNILPPILVRDVEEGLGLVDAEAVDEDVDGGEAGNERGAAFGRAEIEHRGLHLGRRHRALDLGDGLGDRRLGAPVDDDVGAHAGEPERGREPDAPGRARDQRQLSCQIEIHAMGLSSANRRFEAVPLAYSSPAASLSNHGKAVAARRSASPLGCISFARGGVDCRYYNCLMDASPIANLGKRKCIGRVP